MMLTAVHFIASGVSTRRQQGDEANQLAGKRRGETQSV
jgi:hypothetical protein